jgi:hypothetical protein
MINCSKGIVHCSRIAAYSIEAPSARNRIKLQHFATLIFGSLLYFLLLAFFPFLRSKVNFGGTMSTKILEVNDYTNLAKLSFVMLLENFLIKVMMNSKKSGAFTYCIV